MRRAARRERGAEPVASVNLLSPWVFEQLRVVRLRRGFAAGLAGLGLLVAVGWAGQHLRLYEARQDLRGDQAVATGLSHQIAALAPVSDYVAAVERKARTVQRAMYQEVAFSRVLAGLRQATPAGATIDTVAVTLPSPVDPSAPPDPAAIDVSRGIVAECPGPDPFATRPIVGCLNLTGSARDRATVGRLVIALGRAGLFVEPFVSTTTTSGDQPVTFSGSVGLSPQAFTKRYDHIVGLPDPESQG